MLQTTSTRAHARTQQPIDKNILLLCFSGARRVCARVLPRFVHVLATRERKRRRHTSLYFLLALLLCRICQALVFQTDTVVCSGRTAAGLGAFARRLDYVGGRQRLQYYLGDPPKLVSTPQIGSLASRLHYRGAQRLLSRYRSVQWTLCPHVCMPWDSGPVHGGAFGQRGLPDGAFIGLRTDSSLGFSAPSSPRTTTLTPQGLSTYPAFDNAATIAGLVMPGCPGGRGALWRQRRLLPERRGPLPRLRRGRLRPTVLGPRTGERTDRAAKPPRAHGTSNAARALNRFA
jgi:hypothetical protein